MSRFRRRLMAAASALPYDKEVEYLISTATAGISTGINVASDVTFEFDLELPTPGSSSYLFFGREVAGSNLYIQQNAADPDPNNRRTYYKYGTQQPSGNLLWAGAYHFSNVGAANVLEITGYVIRTISASPETFTTTSAILYPYPAAGAVGIKWGPCKIYKAGVLVLDYICVRKGGVGYMYDKVSGQLKGSVTANPFGYGPDKS